MVPAPFRDRTTWLLLGLAFLLYMLHLTHNSFLAFGHDVADHCQYIYFVYKHWSLPKPYQCRECYHMPLYYILSAAVVTVGNWAGMVQPYEAVRLISTGCWFVYLYFCILLLSENVQSRKGYYLALAMMLFSPMSVINATQLLNETPLSMAQLAGFYYLVHWWRDHDPKNLCRALIWNAVALNFKASGLVLTMMIGAVVAVAWKRGDITFAALLNKPLGVGLAILATVGCAPQLRNFYYFRFAQDRPESLFVSNTVSRLDATLPPHPWYCFFGLDLDTYFRYPFLDGYKHATLYVWNMTLKSAILTKHVWRSPELGTLLSALLLILLLFMFWAASSMARRGMVRWQLFPFIFFVVLQLVMLMVFRWLYYRPAHSDYRYVYAITAVFGILFARGIQWCEERGLRTLNALGTAASGLFSVASIALVAWQALG